MLVNNNIIGKYAFYRDINWFLSDIKLSKFKKSFTPNFNCHTSIMSSQNISEYNKNQKCLIIGPTRRYRSINYIEIFRTLHGVNIINEILKETTLYLH